MLFEDRFKVIAEHGRDLRCVLRVHGRRRLPVARGSCGDELRLLHRPVRQDGVQGRVPDDVVQRPVGRADHHPLPVVAPHREQLRARHGKGDPAEDLLDRLVDEAEDDEEAVRVGLPVGKGQGRSGRDVRLQEDADVAVRTCRDDNVGGLSVVEHVCERDDDAIGPLRRGTPPPRENHAEGPQGRILDRPLLNSARKQHVGHGSRVEPLRRRGRSHHGQQGARERAELAVLVPGKGRRDGGQVRPRDRVQVHPAGKIPGERPDPLRPFTVRTRRPLHENPHHQSKFREAV
mmetsp:Transcript_27268/g.54531  ORF Transcript_27268/g.54531 Transcript_27268/m.54531 type:complete len:290 (+) Transcript_27268:375-1244(+)